MRLLVVSLFTIAVIAAPGLQGRQAVPPASITQQDSDHVARAQGVAIKREGYQYAPSLIGNSSFHLGGTLGKARIQSDLSSWLVDRFVMNQSTEADLTVASIAITANQGLHSLEDYTRVLYSGQWQQSVPGGVASGMLTNYTQDLLFSMERLSLNPYPLRRLRAKDPLPFELSTRISLQLTGLPLRALKALGNLFVVDHSYQAKYDKTAKFGAACTAYFFIHPKSGDFLPLAIKTNTGSDLIYTPLDTLYHLVASHAIGEAVHEAALRTLSDHHPVFLILNRLMIQAYAIRPIGQSNLFNPGGAFDINFHISGVGSAQYATEMYPTVGSYQGGYLENDLKSRGLIGNLAGTPFKSFPFYEEALPLRNTLRKFFTTFVDSYYRTDAVVAEDTELQSWCTEAITAARVIDFPTCDTRKKINKKILIDVLTHFAYLTGVAHHVLNTGDPVHTRATLPFHPAALYAPLPTTKGVTDILPFLPPARAALFHIATFAFFNRAYFEAQNRTLVYAFDDEGMLKRLNKKTGEAARVFMNEMKAISAKVRAKGFDAKGLSQGMPFVWKGLDPATVPYFFAV